MTEENPQPGDERVGLTEFMERTGVPEQFMVKVRANYG